MSFDTRANNPGSDAPPLQIFNTSEFKLALSSETHQRILDLIEEEEVANFSLLEVVYVDTDEIIRINREYLGRDYATDIISFRYDEDPDNLAIEGTLYCCTHRIAEQSVEYGTSHNEEFCRVYIHGLLHLIGYDDQSTTEKQKMTALEDKYLGMFLNSGGG